MAGSVLSNPSRAAPMHAARSRSFSHITGRFVQFARLRRQWLGRLYEVLIRRRGWLLGQMTPRKLLNLLACLVDYATKRKRASGVPFFVKIDISPLCSLKCTACVHAESGADESLARQEFSPQQQMSLEQFRLIIRGIRGRAAAVSLYYLGDPYMHPKHDEMCRIARDAGLNVHSSTHFSYAFSNERLTRIVRSGLTHLTVCVDGLSQETYSRTRVGGRIDRVLSNLERLIRIRGEMGSAYPKIEIQFLKYAHNLHELEPARRQMYSMGVEQVEDLWGIVGSFMDTDPGRLRLGPAKRAARLPLCFWPWSGMVIKYNGDVIPCCNYRHGEQYARDGDARPLGNVFTQGVAGVWNSAPYRALRRSVCSPETYESAAETTSNFCHGCPVLFQADAPMNESGMYHKTHERLYALTISGAARESAATA